MRVVLVTLLSAAVFDEADYQRQQKTGIRAQ
jgi:hypothetical protein